MCIEVETSTLAEVDEVVELLQAARQDGAPRSHLTRVMLDNMARRDPAKEGGVDVSLMAEVRVQGGTGDGCGAGPRGYKWSAQRALHTLPLS